MSAHAGRPRWALFLGIAAAVIMLDQLSKAWLESILAPGERLSVIGDLLRLTHAQNSGALFGLFRDQALLVAIVSIGVVGLIIWYHRSSGRNTLLSVALGLLLGGAVGNMIDRFAQGYVTDWVDIGLGDLRFYTFNVADAAISCAILLLIVLAFWPTTSVTTPATGGSGATGPAEADA